MIYIPNPIPYLIVIVLCSFAAALGERIRQAERISDTPCGSEIFGATGPFIIVLAAIILGCCGYGIFELLTLVFASWMAGAGFGRMLLDNLHSEHSLRVCALRALKYAMVPPAVTIAIYTAVATVCAVLGFVCQYFPPRLPVSASWSITFVAFLSQGMPAQWLICGLAGYLTALTTAAVLVFKDWSVLRREYKVCRYDTDEANRAVDRAYELCRRRYKVDRGSKE